MQPANEQRAQVVAAFRRRRSREALASVILAVSIPVAAVASYADSSWRIGGINGAVVVAAMMIVAFIGFHLVN